MTNLSSLKEIVDILSSIVSIAAIIIGGWVAYRKFIREEPLAPRADISHSATCTKLDNQISLVQLVVTIKNVGTTVLKPIEGYSFLQQVLPLEKSIADSLHSGKDPVGETKTEIDWPKLKQRDYPLREDKVEIHPGESERLYCEFIIPAAIKTIVAYSLLTLDREESDLGWDCTTYHDIL